MTEAIPIFDAWPQNAPLLAAMQDRVETVLRSGQFILGPEVEAFEAEAARYLGTKHAIGLNSGTDALVIGLRALGIDAGAEVVTTAFSFSATAEAIRHVGARPVFVDVAPESLNIDPDAIEAAITPRTRAIVPVHLYGLPAEMTRILDVARRHHLRVLEDTAQAFGARHRGRKAGTLGDLGAFSFFPTKTLGAAGDAGMVTTDDDHLAAQARALRVHGARRKYQTEMLGYNSRLDALQAAILRLKLPRVDAWQAERIAVAGAYRARLSGLEALRLPAEHPDAIHAFHQYTVRIAAADRDRVKDELARRGITTMVYYPVPLHRLAVYADQQVSLPEAERAAREVLSLPMFPGLTEQQIDRVATTLREALGEPS